MRRAARLLLPRLVARRRLPLSSTARRAATRRRARSSRRWRPRSSAAARPGSADERAAGDYLAAQLARMGARPLPGRTRHVPGLRVHRRQPRRRLARRRSRRARRRRRRSPAPSDVQALSFSDDAEVSGAGGVRRLRHRGARVAGLRLRQLRHARREGQGRGGAALLPRGRRPADARHPRALLRPALQGDGRAAARRQGARRRHRSALAERRRSPCR